MSELHGEASIESGATRKGARSLPWLVRWLHTYLSMLGFAVIVFFGITGLTLNHADWFESDLLLETSTTGNMPPAALAADAPEQAIDKLAVVEHLRAAHALTGVVTDFQVDAEECGIVFRGPGYTADVVVDRGSGAYEIHETHKGWMAFFNDLHKGRDTGTGWSWLIDIAAVVTTVSGLTGLWLLCYLRKRRRSGLLLMAIGLLAPASTWWLCAP